MQKNGLIEDISDFWDVTGIDKSNFYENVLAKSYVGDTQYGVPWQYNLQYLYYNNVFLRQRNWIRRLQANYAG